MRASTIASLLAIAASSATAQFLNQTAPFALVILSKNSTLNGTSLNPCHEGAAVEGLCLGATFTDPAPPSAYTYNLNYSSSFTVDPTVGQVGYLTYELVGGNFNLSSPMELSYNPTSNVAVPLFTPAESGTEVAFKSDDLMGIPGYVDDTVTPPSYSSKTYYRFYVCETNVGYLYTTLAWALGDHSPENPSCQKVSVKRAFV